MKPSILVVDDEKGLRYTFECFLSDEGYSVSLASNYDEAYEKILKEDFDLIFADIVLGEKTGMDLLRLVKESGVFCPVIMITGYPSLKTASEAVRLGAFDYIAKPVKQEKLIHIAKIALDYKRAVEEKETYRKNLEAIFSSVKDGIITVDKNLYIIEINEAAKVICGLTDGDVTGKPFKNVFKGCNGKECFKALKKSLKMKEVFQLYHLECFSEHNSKQVVTLNISPLINNKKAFLGAVMVIRDETELVEMSRSLQKKGKFHNIIGKSEKMQEIYALLERLAQFPSTVLITGESGTGKELIAEALHYKGSRKNKPIVKVNCSALPENLLESELFGHIKGSFTGALKDKTGWFKEAHKGTIFLDEIGDITPALQLRLLRVLQEKEVVPVGATKPVKVDVRIIASTNQSLEDKIKTGEFREDLYYRLKVVEVKLPPLRERKEDIPVLIEHFVKKFNKSFDKNIKGVSKNALKVIMNYSWPGNIRELEHTIEHAFILSNQFVITLNALPEEIKKSALKQPLKVYDIENEPWLIEKVLEECNWKKTKASGVLGIDRKTLYRKMKKYNIPSKKKI